VDRNRKRRETIELSGAWMYPRRIESEVQIRSSGILMIGLPQPDKNVRMYAKRRLRIMFVSLLKILNWRAANALQFPLSNK